MTMTLTEAQLVAHHTGALEAALYRLRSFSDANPQEPLHAAQIEELQRLQRIVGRARRQIGDQHITESDLALDIRAASADTDAPPERFWPQTEIAQDLYDAKMALADALYFFGRVLDKHGALEDIPLPLEEGAV
jgi:hypothetical protein